MIHTLTQRHLLPMSTLATRLTGIGGIDVDELVASFFRFACQLRKEHAPRRVTDRFRQTMIVGHAIDVQVFYADDAKLIHDVSAVLMGEVLATPRNTLMHPRYDLAMFTSFWRAFFNLGMFPLDLCQCLFFHSEEARVLYLISSGEGRKRLETHINAHAFMVLRQSFGFHLTGETHVPFPCCTFADGSGLRGASQVTMQNHLNLADFGHDQLSIADLASTRNLWEGHAIVAVFPFKARIAGVLTRLASPEKRLKGQIDAHRDVLQDLRMDIIEGRTFLFQEGVRVDLLVAGQTFAGLFVGIAPLFKQVVIQPATFFQLAFQCFLLLFRWIQAILEHLMHGYQYSINRTVVKRRSATPPNPQIRNAPHIPMPEGRGFTARTDKAIFILDC